MVIRNWFDRELITPGGIRNQLLMGTGSSKGLDNRMIDRLENAHLVRKDNRGGRTWIELAHDRLVGPVRQDNEAWFRAETGGWKRRAAPWLFGGALAMLLSFFLRGAVGWMVFLLMVGASILLFTQAYVLTTQQTRQLAMEERSLRIYSGSRTLGVILGIANVLILNAVIGFGVEMMSEPGSRLTGPLLLLFALIIGGLDLMGIALGYAGAKALSRFLVRLRLPYELTFLAWFVAISITFSILTGIFFFFLMILLSY
jgi:hypothetical protein